MGRNVFIFRILRRNVVERKTTKRLKIAKTEPESVGDEFFRVTEKWSSEVGSDGEMVQ